MNCSLCLETLADPESYIDVWSPEGQTLEVQRIVEQHFWLRFDDVSSKAKKYLCRMCWGPIITFHEFYVRIEQAHNPLKELALKIDCDVLIDTQPLPELELNEEILDIEVKAEPNTFNELLEEQPAVEVVEEEEKKDEEPQPQETRKRRRGRPKKSQVEKVIKVPVERKRKAKKKKRSPSPVEAEAEAEVEVEEKKDFIKEKTEVEENNKCLAEVQDTPANESDSDNNDTFNDDPDYEAEIRDCDSDEETEVKKTSASMKEKLLISRKSDAYIAANFELNCCLCNCDLKDFNALKIHFRRKHNIRGYAFCCQKKFLKRGLLVDHLRTHEDPSYFKCPSCNKVMADRRCLELHLKLHEGNRERIFQCNVCSKAFFKRAIYKRHMLLHMPEDEKKEICSFCNKAFPTKYILRQHVHLTHLNTYASICDICGKSIRGGREVFQRHMLLHTGVAPPPVQCKICGTTVTTKYGLSRHMKTMHTEEYRKPFVCEICSKTCPSLQALKSHMKYMHNTQRKHQCPMCDKAFKRPTELKEHLSTHTGEVLYTCPHCPKTFKSNANMHSHRKKMHRAEWEERRQHRLKAQMTFQNACDPKKSPKTSSDQEEAANLETDLKIDNMDDQDEFQIETKTEDDLQETISENIKNLSFILNE